MDNLQNVTRTLERMKTKAMQYPVGHAKRRRLVRRILRVSAAFHRNAQHDPGIVRAYERSARKF